MIIQDDNFIPYESALEFQQGLLTHGVWQFQPQTNIERSSKESLENDHSFQFVHSVFADTNTSAGILRLFKNFTLKHSIAVNEIIRIKSNITTRATSSDYLAPHVDQNTPHKVFLYYVNDSDGDTVFFEQFWHEGINIEKKDLTEALRVSPRMGRGVIFDGLQYHASSKPIKHDYRCVINIDFI